jgi:hypothetical protein
MSTGSNCLFVQVETANWYYLLEHYSAPKHSWDWREHSDAYGPFSSEELAHEHLRQNHANPGGAEISALPNGQTRLDLEKDQLLKRLIEKAEAPRAKSYRFIC